MKAHYVANLKLDELLAGDAAPWRTARAETYQMIGTPLGLQPTPLIQASWKDRRIGAVERVTAAAIHDGETLAFHLEWKDATENRELLDNESFVDAAAVLLPVGELAPLITMGAPGFEVNAWYWRADEVGQPGRNVLAAGLGTTRTVDRQLIRTHGEWKDGRWRVVLARSMSVTASEPLAQVKPGESTWFALAVWDGASGERAGLKAFSQDWKPLEVEAPPTARR